MGQDEQEKFEAEKQLVKESWLHLFVPHEIQKLRSAYAVTPKVCNVHPNCDSSHLTPSKSLLRPLPDTTLDFISTGAKKVFQTNLHSIYFTSLSAGRPQVQVFMGSVAFDVIRPPALSCVGREAEKNYFRSVRPFMFASLPALPKQIPQWPRACKEPWPGCNVISMEHGYCVISQGSPERKSETARDLFFYSKRQMWNVYFWKRMN